MKNTKLFKKLAKLCSMLELCVIWFYCGIICGSQLVDTSFRAPLLVPITCGSICIGLLIAEIIFDNLASRPEISEENK